MIEEIDCSGDFSDKVIPDGPHHLKVVTSTSKGAGKYVWGFNYEDGKYGEILMFGNQMGDLLKSLGCKEGSKAGSYVLNTDITDGGEIDAVFYTDAKGYKRMKDIKGSGIPY